MLQDLFNRLDAKKRQMKPQWSKRRIAKARAKMVLQSVLICSALLTSSPLYAITLRTNELHTSMMTPNEQKQLLIKLSRAFSPEDQKTFRKNMPKPLEFIVRNDLETIYDWEADKGKYTLYLSPDFFQRKQSEQSNILLSAFHEISSFRREAIDSVHNSWNAEQVRKMDDLTEEDKQRIINGLLERSETREAYFKAIKRPKELPILLRHGPEKWDDTQYSSNNSGYSSGFTQTVSIPGFFR